MAVLGIIGIYVFILILFSIIKGADDTTKIITFFIWVAFVLWLLIEKPAFWEGHIALKVICSILCALILIATPNDEKDDEEKKL